MGMDKGRYLELFREREDVVLRNMEEVGKIGDERERSKMYEKSNIPFYMILTQHMMVTLPVKGRLDYHRREPDSWTPETRLSINQQTNDLLYYGDVSPFESSPYGVNILINSRILKSSRPSELRSMIGIEMEQIKWELDVITSNAPVAKDFIDRLNTMHGIVCEERIKRA